MNIFDLDELKTVGQVTPSSIINADCLEAMKYIADKSIDCIICDLPYGITACKWDTVIPFDSLWKHYKRVIKPNGAIALFGSQPFSSALVMSNPKYFKYGLIWDKLKGTSFVLSKIKPMSSHEDVLIFGIQKLNYYPQMELAKEENKRSRTKTYKTGNAIPVLSGVSKASEGHSEDLRYPKSVIRISKDMGETNNTGRLHPTQKPVALIEYLIKTYTQEGELILDNTAGSGTLAIAAINTNRRYICIEKDEHYFEVMRKRIESHDPNAVKPKQKPKQKSQKEIVSDKYVQLSLFNEIT